MSDSKVLARWLRELAWAERRRRAVWFESNNKRSCQSSKRRALYEAALRIPDNGRIVARWHSSDGCRCASVFYGVRAKRGQKL